MYIPSVTIHRDIDGKETCLAYGSDATACLQAYLDCEEPGDVVYIRKGQLEKRKTYKAKRLTVESARGHRRSAKESAAANPNLSDRGS
jgi:hypothetical protein